MCAWQTRGWGTGRQPPLGPSSCSRRHHSEPQHPLPGAPHVRASKGMKEGPGRGPSSGMVEPGWTCLGPVPTETFLSQHPGKVPSHSLCHALCGVERWPTAHVHPASLLNAVHPVTSSEVEIPLWEKLSEACFCHADCWEWEGRWGSVTVSLSRVTGLGWTDRGTQSERCYGQGSL